MPSPPKPQSSADDDLDELDDVLDDFSSPPPPRPASALGSGSKVPTDPQPSSVPDAADALSDDFAQELAKGMESLMRELGGPASGPEPEMTEEQQKVFKAAWEAMLVDGLGGEGASDGGLAALLGETGSDAGASSSSAPRDGKSDEATNEFQKSIQNAMKKLRETEEKNKASDGSSSTSDADALAQLLAQLGEGGGDDNELQGFLEGMMSQLMSKDVLYEPLKELQEKFPAYLASPPTPLDTPTRERYEAQHKIVNQIIAVFDEPGYCEAKEGNTEEQNIESLKYAEKVVGLMGEMQALGSPPSEIMGPLPPGMSLGPDGLPNMDGCCIT